MLKFLNGCIDYAVTAIESLMYNFGRVGQFYRTPRLLDKAQVRHAESTESEQLYECAPQTQGTDYVIYLNHALC